MIVLHKVPVPPFAPRCVCVAELSFPEQIVVWSIRKWLEDRDNAPVIRRELCQCCGPAGAMAWTALESILSLLSIAARRPVYCHSLPCRAIAADEQAILGIIAASQAGDRSFAENQARDLMPASQQNPLLEAVAILGAALQAGNRTLPLRYALPGRSDTIH